MADTEQQQAVEHHVEPQKEHHWLHRLEGEWTYESEASMEPGQPPVKFTGTESVRSLGGLWVQAEGKGEMPGGGEATTLMTLGYDVNKQRYIGTWIGSMMTNMWVYEGELDATEKTLTLDTEGPHMFAQGQTARYRESIEFRNDDERVFRSEMLNDDGSWQQLMMATYRRKK